MPLEGRDPSHLWDMLTAARAIVGSLVGITLERYTADEDLRLTVERRLELIGEAARRLSESFRSDHPEIPWQRVIAQRNFLIHQYDAIDHERIWRLGTGEIAILVRQLDSLLPPSEVEA